jgi:hypothetical protein
VFWKMWSDTRLVLHQWMPNPPQMTHWTNSLHVERLRKLHLLFKASSTCVCAE